MNKQKNKLTKAIAYLTLLFLGIITVSTTASAALWDLIFGDNLKWVAIILGCVIVLALIGLFVYMKIKGVGLSMLLGKLN